VSSVFFADGFWRAPRWRGGRRLQRQEHQPGLISAHSHVGIFVGLKAAAENYNRDSVLRQLKQLEAEAVPETDEACKSCGSDCRFMTSFGKPGSVGSQETGVRCFEYFVPFSAMDVQKTKDRVLEPI
jgi:hypothetical protein